MRKKNYVDSLQIRLREAAQEMILADGINPLTVSAVARQAGISRTTFYLIYISKDELLRDICANFLTDYPEQFMKSQTDNLAEQRSIIIQIFHDIKSQERLLRAVWNVRSDKFNPYLTMQESICGIIRRHMAMKYGESVNANALELFSRYYAANTMETIRWRIENDGQASAEYLYKVIMICLKKGMLHVLD